MSTVGVYVKPQPIGSGVVTTDDVINQGLDFVSLRLHGMVKVQQTIVDDDKEMGAGPTYVKPVFPIFSTNLNPSTSVAEGGNLTLSVAADGGTAPYTFQWYKSTVNNETVNAVPLSGQTTDTLEIKNVTKEVAGGYYAVVTDANGKSVNSKATRVTVTGEAGS